MNRLSGVRWRCASTAPGAVEDPQGLRQVSPDWIDAAVPGTAAGAMRDAGRWSWGRDDAGLYDGRDWWFAATFPRPDGEGPWDLELGGVATLSDVWLNGEHLDRCESMFAARRLEVATLRDDNELVIRCEALGPRLAARHPRPRFKSRLVRDQALRWYRTTLLGRMPGWSRWAAPVGPWREVSLTERPAEGRLDDLDLRVERPPGGGGRVAVAFVLRAGRRAPESGTLQVGDASAPLTLVAGDAGVQATGELVLDEVAEWWPHTHGEQPLYEVSVVLDGAVRPLRRIGFASVELDRSDGGFELRVNGHPCFWRGVTWGPGDGVTLAGDEAQLRARLELARDAGLNLLRLGGYGVYEDRRFWDLCDELGILVWQDVMIASVDPPDAPEFVDALRAEVREQFGALQGRPSLAVACGSSESYQQGSMLGLAPERYRSDVLEREIPAVIEQVVPGTPYVPSSPSGGEPPIRADTGVTHYFGVGAYLRPSTDARLAGVRFAAECLSFANPPERATVERVYGSAAVVGHDPRWKLAVARDAGTSWDFEDVRDHYVDELFGVDARTVRYHDPEHALDLGRAALVELIGRVLGDWRPGASGCSGAIVLAWGDLWPGAGWGMVDADGLPKASFYALARASQPRAVLLRDLGLNGLAIDVYNDAASPLEATLTLTLLAPGGVELEVARRPLSLGGRDQTTVAAGDMLEGFRDLTGAWGLSSALPDAVLARVVAADGALVGRAVHLPAGIARPREATVGLAARATRAGPQEWMLSLTTRQPATFVSVQCAEHLPDDSWFHIAPGETVEVTLRGGERAPRGVVRALNSVATTPIEAEAG